MGAGSEEVAGAGRLFVCLFGGEEWGRRLGTGDFLVCHSLAIWSSIAKPVYGRGRAGDEGEVERLPLHLPPPCILGYFHVGTCFLVLGRGCNVFNRVRLFSEGHSFYMVPEGNRIKIKA